MRGKITVLLTLSITLSCCINADKKRISNIISYWKNREIIFPTKNYFTLMGEDTIPYQWKDASYKIISYINGDTIFIEFKNNNGTIEVSKKDYIFNIEKESRFFIHSINKINEEKFILEVSL